MGRLRTTRYAVSVAVGLVLVAALSLPLASQAAEPFEITSFTSRTTNEAKAEYTAAGGHPYQNYTSFVTHGEELKDAVVTLEPGFFGNPAAAPRCRAENIGKSDSTSNCPPGSKIGVALIYSPILGAVSQSIYNAYPEKGYPAQFAFRVVNTIALLTVVPLPRTEAYGLTVGTLNLPEEAVKGLDLTFYGVPSEHKSGSTGAPFLSNPVDCSNPEPKWGFYADSWENAGSLLPSGQPNLADPNWLTASVTAAPMSGCNDPALSLQFNPSLETKTLAEGGGPAQADQPTGLGVDFSFPQSNDPTNPSTNFEPAAPQAPEPKDITVKLPSGLSINPASADGLGACSDLASDPAGDQVHYDSTKPVTCPDSSKIGTATALSPLLAYRDPITDAVNGAEPIPGTVYLLKPHPGDLVNGQDGKFRLLIQLENADAGINIKLPGVAVADQQTGQLTATFSENPQLPSSSLEVNLKSGSRAPLASPVTCGKFDTTSDLVPWSAPSATTPGTPDAHPTASFTISAGANGTACATSPRARPFAPALSAGTEGSKAGSTSPFVLELTRNDGEQELSALNLTMPPGFAAKLAGVPYCPEAAIAASAAKSGAAEAASPSCPAASQVGTVSVGAGAGPTPYYVNGKAYLGGPYKGAPLSLAFITPAVAGPFDLGDVVVRAALRIDPETAQVSVSTDPLPTILDGMPLRLRSLTARLDRTGFIRNPTSCEEMLITAAVTSPAGLTVPLTNHFQVADCGALGFRPSLGLSLSGGLARNGHPALRTVLRSGADEAGIAAATLTLPGGELLDIRHLFALCARQLPAESCPPASRVGYMRLRSPLLDRPLEGQIYLRAPSHRFPDLLADLHAGGLHVLLHGRTAAPGGRMRISFPALPDLRLTKAVVSLAGGSRGIFVNSEALCARPRRATVSLSAHNGKRRQLRPLLRLRGHC